MQGYDRLSVMVDHVLDYCYQQSAAKEARAKERVNRDYQAIAADYDWPQLLRADESGLRDPSDSNLKTFEAGDAEAPLPHNLGRLKSIQLQTSSFGGGQLEGLDMQDFYDRVSDNLTEAGTPRFYTMIGMTAQTRRIAVAATPTAHSSVTNNNNLKVAHIKFRKALAVRVDQTSKLDLSGTFSTGVSLGYQLPTGYPIERVSLDSGWLGTFRINDGTVDIVSIQHTEEPPTSTSALVDVISHPLIRVWPVPNVDYAATLMWVRNPLPLTEDEDTPDIPVSNYLVESCIGWMLSQEGRHKDAAPHIASAEALYRSLVKKNRQDASRRMTPRGRNFLGMTGVWE